MVILGGTSFTIGENIVTIDETTSYNFSDYISEEGADYYVFINSEGRVIASQIRTPADGYMFIGQFHTLCNGVAANTTGVIPTAISEIGSKILLQRYSVNEDSDFYEFYLKTIDAVALNSQYNLATVLHPLQGFNTGDILPESVWCLNFHPKCKNWDGMVYSCDCNIAVDIYLQNGTDVNTSSVFGAAYTINRYPINHMNDMTAVGKRLVKLEEFQDFALGSESRINTSSWIFTTGGNVYNNNRRIISFIGVEDCTGVSHQIGSILGMNEADREYSYDGNGSLGYARDVFADISLGGAHANFTQQILDIGVRALAFDNINGAYDLMTSRGVCDISIV